MKKKTDKRKRLTIVSSTIVAVVTALAVYYFFKHELLLYPYLFFWFSLSALIAVFLFSLYFVFRMEKKFRTVA